MGLFDSVFGGGARQAARERRRGYERGMGEARQAWQDEQGYLDPTLGESFGGMSARQAMLDPNQFYSNIMSGYEMSPAARREMAEGLEARRNAAAAAGMSGSTDAAADASRFARDFSSNDMQRYYQNQMGIFGGGLGIGNNLANFRDMMGQRMMSGQIGMGEARGQEALARGQSIQNALATGAGLFSGGMGYGPYAGGFQGALQGIGASPFSPQQLQSFGSMMGGA